ncbi:hypothetical protein ASPZODRAFT_75006 [Penicilliopsis zonata CBS 506.65]|uniref:Rad21/Rec8-like protein N-terminal domain-containing protein n=1 Tax=Penicilliopsis zonata CBS 506.65 TaxID=1073090 RepID=A0A1L9S795_9EURO|nr:hypothetical protein ASPZODRAFT_75006 [Penicilliopsis zonata CBS 506.65]OJJ43030.1 hypothetical protein ASPZODRAFT_75006 [Penicilliopsis zonata CBS 506.65]
MFYSHEILTSPEHGVATVWLVATLGSKSIARRLNRKKILDVNVPKACNVIMDPAAPMALRLQGNLLYGVSRVYNQQCGYTLTDAQAIHEKMKTLFKTLPNGGLDLTAGKPRPEQLILPYDPSFLPDVSLPGLNLDFSSACKITSESQQSSVLYTNSSLASQETPTREMQLQLEITSDDLLGNVAGLAPGSEISHSAHRLGSRGQELTLPFGMEEGVLFHPDFEFDENGDIVELGSKNHIDAADEDPSEVKVRQMQEGRPTPFEPEPMMIDDLDHPQPASPLQAGDADSMEIVQDPIERQANMPRNKRAIKALEPDEQIALRNTDLARWNNEYINNMATACKQKQQNKLPTQAKRNAEFWVFGQGIGSVGAALGSSNVTHPLKPYYSGEELIRALQPNRVDRKRGHASTEDSDSGSTSRRVRARGEHQQMSGNGSAIQDDAMNLLPDVELGRHAPPALHDDSSMMPWNVTGSVNSSRFGSAHILHGLTSVGACESAAGPSGGWLSGSRLTSASPLAGRGYGLDSRDRLSSLDIPGHELDDLQGLGEFDLTEYLQNELESNFTAATNGSPRSPGQQREPLPSVLDQESQNFLDYVTMQMAVLAELEEEEEEEKGDTSDKGKAPAKDLRTVGSKQSVSFTAVLPPGETTRAVATHALMHVLALATKGVLVVQQESTRIEAHGDATRYVHGDILMRLV